MVWGYTFMPNPFNDYRLQNKLTWPKLAQMCGLLEGQIAYLNKMDADRIGNLSLRTVAKIKMGTGVDLLKYLIADMKEKSSSEMAAKSVDETVAE